MKLALVLASCLALLGCGKKKDADPKPTAPAAGTAAPAAGTAAPAAGTAAPAAGTAAPAAGTAAPVDLGEVTIPWAGHTAGERVTKIEDREMKAKVEAQPGELVDVLTVEHREESRETLTAEGGVLTKAKLGYAKMSLTETLGDKSRQKPSPTDGKTYLAWREGGELKITLEDGSAPTPEELKVVTKDARTIGKPDAMEQLIAGRPWKLGVAVTLDAAQLATIGEAMSDDSSKLTSMTLTLKTVDDATATFLMATSMGGATAQGGSMKVEIAGTVVLDRKTGRVQSMDLTGPLEGIAGKEKLKIVGTMTSKVTYTY